MAFLRSLFSSKRIEGESSDNEEQLRMLVSGVYVMHEPSEGRRALMDIVFFHGLQLGDYKKAYEETWESITTSGAKVCWPREWLGQDFPSARILSISYDSGMLGSESAGKQGKVVVDLISSSQNAFIPVVPIDDADHITICKPNSKNAETYLYLKDFIEGVIKLDENDKTRYPDRLVEAIRSQGPNMHRTLHSINEFLQNKEEKAAQGKDLTKETQLATDLVSRGALPCIVKVLQGLGTGQHGTVVVSEAGWVLDNMLEYGDTSFFDKAVDAGAVDALVGMLTNLKTAPSAVSVLRNLTDECIRSHPLLARLEANAKPALHNLTCSDSSYVCQASKEILTTMGWTTRGERSGSYLTPNEPIIEEV